MATKRKNFRARRKPAGRVSATPRWMRRARSRVHKVLFIGGLNTVSMIRVVPSEITVEEQTRLKRHDLDLLPDEPRTVVSISDDFSTVVLHLTAMTEQELVTLRELLGEAFDAAQAVASKIDKEVEHAHDQGLNLYARGYRVAPDVVDRSGDQSEHGPRL